MWLVQRLPVFMSIQDAFVIVDYQEKGPQKEKALVSSGRGI
jgi:hypothetical protein